MEANLEYALQLLNTILALNTDNQATVDNFINYYNEEMNITSNPLIEEILGDLAHDLEYYVANEKNRAEDNSFYGLHRLKKEVTEALSKIQKELEKV